MPPPPPTNPPLLISPHATLTGPHPITVAPTAIIHLRARLIAKHIPVTVGDNCIVCERASVGILAAGEDHDRKGGDGEREKGVVLERGVVVETGAVVEARWVGEGTVVEVGAKVGRGCIVGKHCKITPYSILPPYTTLADFTVVYGHNERRVDRSGLQASRARLVEKHVELLRGLGVGGGGGGGGAR